MYAFDITFYLRGQAQVLRSAGISNGFVLMERGWVARFWRDQPQQRRKAHGGHACSKSEQEVKRLDQAAMTLAFARMLQKRKRPLPIFAARCYHELVPPFSVG
jgi:hypothetical protein